LGHLGPACCRFPVFRGVPLSGPRHAREVNGRNTGSSMLNKKLSIRKKIFISFGLLVFLTLIGTSFGYYRYHLLYQKLHLVEYKNNMLNMILEARRYEKNFFLTQNIEHLKSAKEYAKKSREVLVDIKRLYGKYAHSNKLDEQMRMLRQYVSGLDRLTQSVLRERKNASEIEITQIESLKTYQKNIRSLGHDVTTALETALQKERGVIRNLVRESRIYLFMSLGIIVLIALSTFAFLFYHVEQPLRRIGMAIQKIASGDYQNIPEVETGDEFENLAHSLNVMLDELNKRSEQLIQSEKMAALGTLTSGVAHEINNPLNNISTSLQILLEELEEGDLEYQRELLTETGREVERTQDIVRALLEYSRRSTFSVSRERFRDLMDNALKLIQGEIPSNVNVELDIPEDIHAVVDSRRIQQVLLNLMINGFQAMEPDGGTLRLSAFEDEKGSGFYFRVQDTGKGIPKDQLNRIFDPFYTTKEASGSGMGLSVSRGIIESHRGSIAVDSREGRGSTFTIYLPYEQNGDKNGTEAS